MARTQLAGHVRIDPERTVEDLARTRRFRYSDAYSDYLVGGPWHSLMLWSTGGDGGDGVITNYDHTRRGALTEYGSQLPYLSELIRSNFDVEHLNFARLVVMSGSVTLPHRDLLELGDIPQDRRMTHRVHIPLVTHEDAFHTEDNLVYHMDVGDVWVLDASRVHAAAVLSDRPRVHLMLDFTEVDDLAALARFGWSLDGLVPAGRIREREALKPEEYQALLRLADVITVETWREVASIVVKTHFRKDGGDEFVWRTLEDIAARCPEPAVQALIAERKRFFLMERSAS